MGNIKNLFYCSADGIFFKSRWTEEYFRILKVQIFITKLFFVLILVSCYTNPAKNVSPVITVFVSNLRNQIRLELDGEKSVFLDI